MNGGAFASLPLDSISTGGSLSGSGVSAWFKPPSVTIGSTTTFVYAETHDFYSAGIYVGSSTFTLTCVESVLQSVNVTNSLPTSPTSPTSATVQTQFWNPNDGRVDPHQADRLAVYCNQSDKIVVYGVSDTAPQDQSGFFLTMFSYKEVAGAGHPGITHTVGVNGRITVSLIDGWFWIAWNGGQFHATGQDTFVKNFSDDVWCSAVHPLQ